MEIGRPCFDCRALRLEVMQLVVCRIHLNIYNNCNRNIDIDETLSDGGVLVKVGEVARV
jgi:hypothetical protein